MQAVFTTVLLLGCGCKPDASPVSICHFPRRLFHRPRRCGPFERHLAVSGGHGFAGIGRKTMLILLQARARELGVKLHFEIRRQGKPVDPAKYLPAR